MSALNLFRLDGRVAFVTGGAQGIGFSVAKAAVHQLTRSLAAEWAPRGVRVNAVAPTYIEAPLNAFADKTSEMYRRWIDGTPMGRLGTRKRWPPWCCSSPPLRA